MKPLVLVAAIAAVGLIGGCRSHSGSAVAIDFVERFPFAIEAKPSPATFSIGNMTIHGRQERSIVIDGTSRVVYQVAVPARAELRTAFGLPDGDRSGDTTNVLFRIMIATEGSPGPDVMFHRRLEPSTSPGDRGWHDVTIDLSPFASETIMVFLNTDASSPGRSVWGAPRVIDLGKSK